MFADYELIDKLYEDPCYPDLNKSDCRDCKGMEMCGKPPVCQTSSDKCKAARILRDLAGKNKDCFFKKSTEGIISVQLTVESNPSNWVWFIFVSPNDEFTIHNGPQVPNDPAIITWVEDECISVKECYEKLRTKLIQEKS